MRVAAFFKLYQICTLLHRSKLNCLAKNRFKKSAIKFWRNFNFKTKPCKNLQNVFCKFSKFQKHNLVDDLKKDLS